MWNYCSQSTEIRLLKSIKGLKLGEKSMSSIIKIKLKKTNIDRKII